MTVANQGLVHLANQFGALLLVCEHQLRAVVEPGLFLPSGEQRLARPSGKHRAILSKKVERVGMRLNRRLTSRLPLLVLAAIHELSSIGSRKVRRTSRYPLAGARFDYFSVHDNLHALDRMVKYSH